MDCRVDRDCFVRFRGSVRMIGRGHLLSERLQARAARREDGEAIASIYNQGIEDRVATFETRPRTAADVDGWFDGAYPCVVVTLGERIVAFASTKQAQGPEPITNPTR